MAAALPIRSDRCRVCDAEAPTYEAWELAPLDSGVNASGAAASGNSIPPSGGVGHSSYKTARTRRAPAMLRRFGGPLLCGAMDVQHDPAQHLSTIETLVCLRRFSEWIARCDGHTNLAAGDVTIQLREFTWGRNGVEGTDAESAALSRLRIDAVRVDDASSLSHEVEAALESITSGERQHAIQSVGCERPQSLNRFVIPRVDDSMRTKAPNETSRWRARCGRDHLRSALSRKLHRD